MNDESFNIPTKLKGTAIYKNGNEEEFEIRIPEYDKKSSQIISTSLKDGRICSLYLSLVPDEDDENNEVLAMAIFEPSITSLSAIKIGLIKSKMLITPTYNLPPKFDEN